MNGNVSVAVGNKTFAASNFLSAKGNKLAFTECMYVRAEARAAAVRQGARVGESPLEGRGIRKLTISALDVE